ncbi:MAG: HD domain-containing protein, partial [Chloroflexi bacterium]|nr:HD domain-containing protein [Chloroflexota bacterium]
FRTARIEKTAIRLGEGLAGRAALERRLVSVPDLNRSPAEFSRAALLAGEQFVAYCAMPLIAKGEIKGVLELFHRAALPVLSTAGARHEEQEWLAFLEALAGQAAIAVDNARLFDGLQRSNSELALAYDATIEGWARALDLRDKETEGHTQRVTEMSQRLARAMGLSEAELIHLRRGALLHDIGKMGVPDSILLKPGPLTAGEWEIKRQHPVYAHEMLSPIAHLRPALDIPHCHHEKWDGSDYPRGLKGEGIPLTARIFAVVDVWDALRSDRPYRSGWPEDRVRNYILEEKGKHFDSRVAGSFLALLE